MSVSVLYGCTCCIHSRGVGGAADSGNQNIWDKLSPGRETLIKTRVNQKACSKEDILGIGQAKVLRDVDINVTSQNIKHDVDYFGLEL